MRIVLDTNVLVFALLSPYGPPAEVLRLVVSGDVTLCLDTRIVTEYEQVLARPRFLFSLDAVTALVDYLVSASVHVVAPPLPEALPGPDDEPFMAVAIAGAASHLVTGNRTHFPAAPWHDVVVATPAEFLQHVRRSMR